MPAAAPTLLPIFRSRAQGTLLALILDSPERQWTIGVLADGAGVPYQTVAAELRRLEGSVVTTRHMGRTKLVQANTASPYYTPLRELAVIAFGAPQVVAEELDGVEGIAEVMIFGSWAARFAGRPGSEPNDIDVLVIGSPDPDELFHAVRRVEQRLRRPVNPTVRSLTDWEGVDDSFAAHVRASPIVSVPYHRPDAEMDTWRSDD